MGVLVGPFDADQPAGASIAIPHPKNNAVEIKVVLPEALTKGLQLPVQIPALAVAGADEAAQQRSIEYFFEQVYGGYLTDFKFFGCLKGRHFNIILFVVWFAVFAFLGSQLGPASKASEFLPEWHPLQKFFSYWSGDKSPFRESSNDNNVQITYVFGLDGEMPLDRTGTDRFDEVDRGKLVVDPDFDIASTASQQHYRETCNTLRKGDGYDGKLTRQNKLDDQNDECHCIINDAVDWYNSKSEPAGTNETLPEGDFRKLIDEFLDTQDGGKLRYQMGLDRSVDKDGAEYLKPYFAYIKCNTSVVDQWAPYTFFAPYEEAQDKFVETVNEKASKNDVKGMKKMFQTARGMWVRNKSQRLYLSDAIQGMGMSLGLAFIILFISTANIIVAVFALLNIVGIVASIAGTMVLQGQELGTMQSICLTILVGLSVDYVVHLANCYMEAPFPDRVNRTKSALGEMGITVLGGAITSLGASAMLFACYLVFFKTFGSFMFFTITFSIVWAMGFFMAVMATFGPEGNSGSIVCLRRLLGHKVEEEEVPQAAASDEVKSGDL